MTGKDNLSLTEGKVNQCHARSGRISKCLKKNEKVRERTRAGVTAGDQEELG